MELQGQTPGPNRYSATNAFTPETALFLFDSFGVIFLHLQSPRDSLVRKSLPLDALRCVELSFLSLAGMISVLFPAEENMDFR